MISYNHLHLPKKITFNGGEGEITYLYTANGNKVSKTVTEGTTITNTHYLDGFQYVEDDLEFFPHAEGYVKHMLQDNGPLFNYVYNYTDHLGNIRLRYAQDPQTQALTILEEDHYYPFGLKHKGYESEHKIFEFEESSSTVVLIPITPDLTESYKYKFGGKELQSEFGIEMYDFGARNYDPAIGRWMNVDPLAEKYYGINPYAYVFNNPAQLIDPDGRKVEYVREEGQSRKEFRQARREFKSRNRELSRNSLTHKNNFQQLKQSDNTHSISFNRGKGSSVERIGDINRDKGNSTNISIDLEQQSDGNQGNEFVIAHEVGHGVENDNGTASPFEYNASLNDTDIVNRVFENNAKNEEFNESQASHIENIVRGEVSQSTGTVVPLRETYTINVESFVNGVYNKKKEVINVIRKNYDYYGSPNEKTQND